MSGISRDVQGNLTIKDTLEWYEMYDLPRFPNKEIKASKMEQDYHEVLGMFIAQHQADLKTIEQKNDELTRSKNSMEGPLRGEISVLEEQLAMVREDAQNSASREIELGNANKVLREERDRWKRDCEKATAVLDQIHKLTQGVFL